ncbi:MAG: lactonase family protein [Acidobacteriaceae bacterium]|nr:lactonase family protein [Acidobacteriaceae bacterium]
MENAPQTDQTDYFVYIGTYGEGVEAFRFNSSAGKLEPLGLAGAIPNPSFLATDREFRNLYAVSEIEGNVEGGVASFRIDRKTGDLHLLSSMPSGGVAPCHLTLDRTGKVLLVANYMTGSVSAYPAQSDGHLGEMSALVTAEGSSVNVKRQEGPHAHFIAIGDQNDRIYVADLGLDRLRLYRLDPKYGTLTPDDPPYVQVEPGLGPRHLVFSSDARFAYVLNELKPQVAVFTHDPATGRMTPIQHVRTLPEDYKEETRGAEIALDAAGRYLYTSNRGHDSLQVFAVTRDAGTLTRIQIVPIAGKSPRGFAIDPTGRFLLVGGEVSKTLETFLIDPKAGTLSPAGKPVDVTSPVDVKFVPVQ